MKTKREQIIEILHEWNIHFGQKIITREDEYSASLINCSVGDIADAILELDQKESEHYITGNVSDLPKLKYVRNGVLYDAEEEAKKSSDKKESKSAEEILKKHLINTDWGDANDLEREMRDNKDQVNAIVRAMEEYASQQKIDLREELLKYEAFIDSWTGTTFLFASDEEIVNEYLKSKKP